MFYRRRGSLRARAERKSDQGSKIGAQSSNPLEPQASPKAMVRRLRHKTSNPKPETSTPSPKPQLGLWFSTRNLEPSAPNPEPQGKTSNPKPKTLRGSLFSTRILEPYAANPEPQAQNLEPQTPKFELQPQSRKIARKCSLFEAFPR